LDLAPVIAALVPLRPTSGTFVLGVTGSVAAGKSTLAHSLKAALEGPGQRVEIACSDGFLRPNADLAAADLLSRKGFPETYDHAAMAAALRGVRTGPAVFPAHSPTLYDIDPALARTLDAPDVLILEGLALPRGALDALIYLDAAEADLFAWFAARFMGHWEAAQGDPGSFYARFPTREAAERVARMVWDQVNLPNLREHIAPARALADLVIRKGPNHEIAELQVAPQQPS
jgi:type I pantothenate kinase